MAGGAAHTVIVGGGAIGLSVAYHLGRLGVRDIVLLERDQLTSGTSWHAAGIVGPLRASMNLTRLARYALDLFGELESETGQATGYRQTGGVWLAQNADRIEELKRIKGMGDRSGLRTEMLDAGEIVARIPQLQGDDLAGGLWVDADGQVNPVDLCMAYARAARALGVDIREHCAVDDIETGADGVRAVILAGGERLACRKLVICAGAWSRLLAARAGVGLPMASVEHMYLVTEAIDGLADPFPIVRDLDSGIYLKGDAGKLVLGAFEANPKPWLPRTDDAGFLMFDEDWEHAQPMLEAGIRRVPAIADHGVTHFMNGPESFTVDTRQIMGEAPQCAGLFVATGFNSIGIMSSAGVGRVMADWIRDGEAPMDLWEVDIARFDPLQSAEDYLAERIPEAVHNQFAMHWPFKQYRGARDRRRSPWHDALARQGAVFGAPTGWERPLWYATRESEARFEYNQREQCWWPAAAREARHCQQAVSLFELSPFSKIEVSGDHALEFLQRLCCGDVDIDIGAVRYNLMLNRRGGIEAEVTLTRLSATRFRVVSGAATRFKDLHWLRRHAGAGRDLRIVDVSTDYAVLGVMGPRAPALMGELAGGDFGDNAFPFSSAREIVVDGVELLATRLSFVGEAGFELCVANTGANALLERVIDAGRVHQLGFAGHFALDACRLEMGYRHWGHDMGPEDTPWEAGLGFAVNLDKADAFIGREALLRQREQGWKRQLRLCEVAAESALLLHDEPVYAGADIVAHCTSGGYGYRTGKLLCLAMFYDREDMARDNLQIDIAGERFDLHILDQPPYRKARP